VRQWLALLGARSLDDIVGRTDLLEVTDEAGARYGLDLAPLLAEAGRPGKRGAPGAGRDGGPGCAALARAAAAAASGSASKAGACGAPALVAEAGSLALRLDADLADAIAHKRGGTFRYAIENTDRSIGARLSGRIARLHGDDGMCEAPVDLHFSGTAGQCFGAFLAGGRHLTLEGEATDYVGKGMAGGRIVLRPPPGAGWEARHAPILGNTCLYGATGGELYAAGRAGERFAVRNSGALAVVEGAGDHCCEYMTGGVVAVLGRTGLNFGAGFT